MTYVPPPAMKFWDLDKFQAEHRSWLEHNFPSQKSADGLIGVVEEVGELAHAHLKFEQGIRNYQYNQYKAEALDAIGDIIVYLASYCNTNNLSLAEAIEEAWDEVRTRDWQLYPGTGKPQAEVREGSDSEASA